MMGSSQIKVSIIVPVYNTQKYLRRCMESLIYQTLPEIEIILVDDGSEPECADICNEWAKKDDRIRVIHKQNEGLGFARNTGMAYASGKYLAFVDSDDYVDRKMYAELYEQAEAYTADMVVGGYAKKYADGKEELCIHHGIPKVMEGKEINSILLANMLGAPPEYYSDDYIGMSVWKNIYKREILKKNGIKFPSEREYISEDIIFHIGCLQHMKKAVVVHKPYYFYCQNEGSLSGTYRKDRFQRVLQLYLYEKKLLQEANIYEAGRLQLQRTFVANVRVCIIMESQKGRNEHQRKASEKIIKMYCADQTVQEVLGEYPYRKLPLKQKIFSEFMKKKNAWVLYMLANAHSRRNVKKKGK